MTASRIEQRLALVNQYGRTRLTPELIDQLCRMMSDTACITTLEGASGSFCEGLDIELLAREAGGTSGGMPAVAYLARFAALLQAIQSVGRPVVALLDGPALGGGLGLAAAADLVLATPRSTFALPETLLGIIPAVVFPVIARRIGIARTRLLALGAHTLSAQQALEAGLVDEVVDDLQVAFARYARRFSRMDLRAIGEIKRLTSTFSQPRGYLEAATSSLNELLHSHETQARLERFVMGETPWPEDD